jgi:RimJ/RimL family protein N-acetyltransferase
LLSGGEGSSFSLEEAAMSDHNSTLSISGRVIITPRLRLRPWRVEDSDAALRIFGQDEVARWLAPAMDKVRDTAAMHDLIQRWVDADDETERPTGRWAVEDLATGGVVGAAAVLPLPPLGEDLEIGWQLAPEAWGRGFATEAGHALAHYAFSRGEDEVFAVVRPRNTRGTATARRVGMEWVGETDKYYDLRLQVFRLRKGELDVPGAAAG